jgi:DNA-binding NarL/FixJ family response regulator
MLRFSRILKSIRLMHKRMNSTHSMVRPPESRFKVTSFGFFPQGPPLTDTQWMVAAWVNEGLTNKEIASRMGTAENTVKHHVQQIMDRIEPPSRTRSAVAVWYEVMRRNHETPGAAPQCPRPAD